ncbi:hypothetical protein [Agrococcus casei]|uniref:Uncharacterized protein n=1 Tax=Agrococcus casei LMG 22410 TaxID=1255656 RepID=A0A1R4FA91_9MICO|nr:hypothetical protein [Agrococcus casei]SJM52776.1 hypothetical protein CZ674_03380 [Agrococcus casei LMG 22410]
MTRNAEFDLAPLRSAVSQADRSAFRKQHGRHGQHGTGLWLAPVLVVVSAAGFFFGPTFAGLAGGFTLIIFAMWLYLLFWLRRESTLGVRLARFAEANGLDVIPRRTSAEKDGARFASGSNGAVQYELTQPDGFQVGVWELTYALGWGISQETYSYITVPTALETPRLLIAPKGSWQAGSYQHDVVKEFEDSHWTAVNLVPEESTDAQVAAAAQSLPLRELERAMPEAESECRASAATVYGRGRWRISEAAAWSGFATLEAAWRGAQSLTSLTPPPADSPPQTHRGMGVGMQGLLLVVPLCALILGGAFGAMLLSLQLFPDSY